MEGAPGKRKQVGRTSKLTARFLKFKEAVARLGEHAGCLPGNNGGRSATAVLFLTPVQRKLRARPFFLAAMSLPIRSFRPVGFNDCAAYDDRTVYSGSRYSRCADSRGNYSFDDKSVPIDRNGFAGYVVCNPHVVGVLNRSVGQNRLRLVGCRDSRHATSGFSNALLLTTSVGRGDAVGMSRLAVAKKHGRGRILVR